ncbi:hypothetical protein U0070_002048 [Myodes glareolus]|uniref:U6 snRNA-associated Sm-like protein LSm6 n=1 Tax=Myodes glareolus TaxID=447135 RepID=A0AAW0HVI2_MYOGA
MSLRKQTPSDFLKQIIGRPVVVKLNSGVDYRGVLACLDGYMNIALEQTEEYVNGQLKNKYGDAFIRGNNGNRFLVVVFRIRLCLLCEGAGGFYVMKSYAEVLARPYLSLNLLL